jgi:hypothetical protein
MKHRESLVTWGNWSVSTCNPPMRGGPGYELSVIRHHGSGRFGLPLSQGGTKFQYGFEHGRIFKTREEADQFCLEHGYLQRYFTSPELRARRIAANSRPGHWARRAA